MEQARDADPSPMQVLEGDCWSSEGTDDELARPSPTLELWNEHAPMRIPRCLCYSLFNLHAKERDLALLLADDETMHAVVRLDEPHP